MATSTNLLELTCLFNQLTSLDVSENPNKSLQNVGLMKFQISMFPNLHLQTLVVDSQPFNRY
ncbi:MAG: hypothetical protein R2773_03030 [Flavobacteriaceae bacterium]